MAEVILFEKLSWQVRLWVFAFHELLQSSLHRGLRKQVAEDIDLLPQVLIGNRLDEFFGHICRVGRRYHAPRGETRLRPPLGSPAQLAEPSWHSSCGR